MNTILRLLLIALFFTSFIEAKAISIAKTTMEATASRIVDDLYETMGNKVYPRPQVVVVNCLDIGNCAGARYKKRSNVIELEDHLYNVCRSFGKDSLNALAFVLGHELGHFYNNHQVESSGFGDNNNVDTDVEKEHLADIHGIFNAYLAGYDIRSIVPKLLDAIYEAYQLKGQPMYSYPSLADRQHTPNEVLEQVNKLIHVFELANYLSAIGSYDAAASSYQYILGYYKGKEIYNNLGVCYSLHAMNFTDVDYDLYLFPFELDLDTRLKKDKSGTGIDALSREDIRKRTELLNNAMIQFKIVSKMDKSYLLDDLNRICVHILNQEYGQAQQYFQASAIEKKAFYLNKNPLEKAKIELVRALMLVYDWNGQQEAIQIWTDLSTHSNEGIAYQAQYNLAILTGKKTPSCESDYECYEPVNTNQSVDQFQFSKQNGNGFYLDDYGTQLNIIKKQHSFIYVFSQSNGRQLVLQRTIRGSFKDRQRVSFPDLHFNSINTTLANGYYYITCDQKNTAFLSTPDNRVKEWVQFQWY